MSKRIGLDQVLLIALYALSLGIVILFFGLGFDFYRTPPRSRIQDDQPGPKIRRVRNRIQSKSAGRPSGELPKGTGCTSPTAA